MVSNLSISDRVKLIVDFLLVFHPDGVLTLQTFGDSGSAQGEAKTHNSTSLEMLPSVVTTVLESNTVEQGHGVYFTVNRTNGQGRKTSDIKAVNGLFFDMDGAEPKNLDQLPELSAVVQSKNGKHGYLLFNEPQIMDSKEFRELQKGLAKIVGGDLVVCDKPRVMRVPFTLHLKNPKEPFEVTLVKCSPDQRYSLELLASICLKPIPQVQASTEVSSQQPTKKVERQKKDASTEKTASKLEWKLHNALLEQCATLKFVKEGERNATLNKVAYLCGSLVNLGLNEDTVSLELFKAGLEMGLGEDEVGQAIDSGLPAGIKKCHPLAVYTPESKLLRAKLLIEHTLQGRVKYDTRNNELLLDGQIVSEQKLYWATVQDLDMDISMDTFKSALFVLVEANSFDPIKDYLQGLQIPSEVNVLPQLCSKVFGLDDPLYTLYMKVWMIGAVKRVMEPGCKHDLVLVLQGDQGTGKSQFLEKLTTVGKRPYKRELSASQRGKDELMLLRQAWVAEFSELGQQFRQRDNDSLKQVITAQHDDYRVPYGSEVKSFPRQSVFAATTNDESPLANDPTGYRRYLPIITGSNVFDLDWLDENKDAIWADAVALYLAGEKNYLSREMMALQAQVNTGLTTHDPLADKMQEFYHAWISDTYFMGQSAEGLDAVFAFTGAEILGILNNSGFKIGNSKGDLMRLASVMKGIGCMQKKTNAARYWVVWDNYYRPKTGTIELRRTIERMTAAMLGALNQR